MAQESGTVTTFDEELIRVFPRTLERGHTVTSEVTQSYNCFSWVIGRKDVGIWPDSVGETRWIRGLKRVESVEAIAEALRVFGFEPCEDRNFERAYLKVLLMAKGPEEPTHLAFQLPSGLWSSKLGGSHDIEHAADGLCGDYYGDVVGFFRRPALAPLPDVELV